jgi:hypothetical protein
MAHFPATTVNQNRFRTEGQQRLFWERERLSPAGFGEQVRAEQDFGNEY